MPNPGDQERASKNNSDRFTALWNRAYSDANPQSWSQWWSAGISRLSSAGSAAGSMAKSTVTSGAKHVALHTTAKFIVFGVGWLVGAPAWIAGIVAWGVGDSLANHLGPKAMDQLADYGGGVAEDWIKFFAEEGGGMAVKARSGEPALTETEKQQKNLREKTDKMFATIGALDLLMRQMNDLKDKPLVYCDDGNLLARLQSRIDAEIARAKKQVTKLERQLGSLKSSIEGRENVNNQIRPIVEGAVKQVVKAGAAPHWTNTITDNLAAMYRCSKQHCFGPGTGSPANDTT
jgi:hypothetical protein